MRCLIDPAADEASLRTMAHASLRVHGAISDRKVPRRGDIEMMFPFELCDDGDVQILGDTLMSSSQCCSLSQADNVMVVLFTMMGVDGRQSITLIDHHGEKTRENSQAERYQAVLRGFGSDLPHLNDILASAFGSTKGIALLSATLCAVASHLEQTANHARDRVPVASYEGKSSRMMCDLT